MIEEGCSKCGCGIQGACDKLYIPGFAVPGIIILVSTLLTLIVLRRKKIIQNRLKMLFVAWLILAIILTSLVISKIESEGDRIHKAAKSCQNSGNPTCEY